jgi:glycerophosphoryl diester phosphodiesterase
VTLVVAHRGASAIAPENSLEAFEAAIAVGADKVEFDVRRTLDGVLVVVHDPLPLVPYDELDPRPPRLEEVVRVCAGRIALDVELKEAGLEREVLELVEATEFVVTSFLPQVVETTKRVAPAVRAGLLVDRHATWWDIGSADFLAPHYTLLDRDLPGELVVWTVNADEDLRQCLDDARVAAVITDDPAHALVLRSGR